MPYGITCPTMLDTSQFGWASVQLDGGLSNVTQIVTDWFESDLGSGFGQPPKARAHYVLPSVPTGRLATALPQPWASLSVALRLQTRLLSSPRTQVSRNHQRFGPPRLKTTKHCVRPLNTAVGQSSRDYM